MALPRDSDTLKIPAFMRKRSISSRLKRPLILTALDRKRAGILPEGLKTKKKITAASKRKLSANEMQQNNLLMAIEMLKQAQSQKPKPRRRKNKKTFFEPLVEPLVEALETFAEPLIETPIQQKKSKKVGILTHYYDKIRVGVIKLSAALSVGDCIKFETADGDYEQVVESMEIDRNPVFKAGKGDEIGIKLSHKPAIDGKIFKI